MRLSLDGFSADIEFYSAIFYFLILVIYLVKSYTLEEKYPRFIKYSLFIDKIYILIGVCVFVYELQKTDFNTTCDFFHDCYEGANDTLHAESYWFKINSPTCPHITEMVDSFSERHSNGPTEIAPVPWGGAGGATICPESDYDCCYLSTHCDSTMKRMDTLSEHWTYTSYLRRPPRTIEWLHFASVNTYITQRDENGTNCPDYEDIILDYLHKERESGLNYFMYMLYLYVLSTITSICYYNKCMKKDVKHQYGGLEEDSSRLRGSA